MRIPISERYVRLASVAALLFLLLGPLESCNKKAPSAKHSVAPDPSSEIADLLEGPYHATIVADRRPDRLVAVVLGADDTLRLGSSGGPPLLFQDFVYDAASAKARAAGSGASVNNNGVSMSLSFGGGFSGRMGMIFGNTYLDISATEGIAFGDLHSSNGKKLATIRIRKRLMSSGRIFTTEDYVVFPDDVGASLTHGPFVTVEWESDANKRVIARRNGKPILDGRVSSGKPITVELTGVDKDNDVVEWEIANRNQQGIIAFPVRGAVPGVVIYRVIVDSP